MQITTTTRNLELLDSRHANNHYHKDIRVICQITHLIHWTQQTSIYLCKWWEKVEVNEPGKAKSKRQNSWLQKKRTKLYSKLLWISRVLRMIKATPDFKEWNLRMFSRGDMNFCIQFPKGQRQQTLEYYRVICMHPNYIVHMCRIFCYQGKSTDFTVYISVGFFLTQES